ncbi:MAG TPA: ABC transporter ATP-binding protein [Brumimicrobium sp.]|nr:ABC transporter ATP-binding protein [Brumimicrobium sp.]
MIEVKNLYKKFGKNEVLKGIDLTIADKGVFAVLGPNGSGKTTLIKSILGMVIPNSGEILIDGESTLNNWQYREKIGYLPQIANFPVNLTVKELFKMIKDLRQSSSLDESRYIEKLGLTSHMSKKLGNLSGGTKQKVNLVLTFLFDSPYIILDEPTTGLDPIALLILKEFIEEEKEKGKTILLTSHIMSFVEDMADEIVFLLEGKVYFRGSAAALKEQTGEVDFEHAIANLLKTQYV